MPKESTILLYNSSTTGSAPTGGDLSLGELAVNTMDEKVFLKAFGGSVLSLSQTKDLSGAFATRSTVVNSVNGLTGAVTNVAVTNAANTFTARQTFSAGITSSDLWVSNGATFGASKIDLTSTTATVQGYSTAGYLKLQSVSTSALLSGTPSIVLQDADTDIGGIPRITISPTSTGVGSVTLGTAGSSNTFDGTSTFSVRSIHSGGLTTANLWVSTGATFGTTAKVNSVTESVSKTTGALIVNGGAGVGGNIYGGGDLFVTLAATFGQQAHFSTGITTSQLFVSSGATFNSTSTFTGRSTHSAGVTAADLFVSNGATFGGLANKATLKDYGEVYAYQVRKEIGDSKTASRYYIHLEYGNTFYLDLTQSSDNSGTVGGYATQQALPAIRLPAYGYATVSTTAGLTGATAAFAVGSGTQAVTGAYIFGPGLTERGVTALGYNNITQALVLSKPALRTVSSTCHAFVQNIPEGYGMVGAPFGGSVSTPSPARVHSFTLIVNSATAGSITWQTGTTAYGAIKWPGGTPPTLSTTANKLDVFSFLSTDWGTSWLGFNAGQNF